MFEVFSLLFPRCGNCEETFSFPKRIKFPRLGKIFGNVFQISEVECVTVMPIVSNKWNI